MKIFLTSKLKELILSKLYSLWANFSHKNAMNSHACMANHDKKEEHSSNVCIALSKKQPDYKGHDALGQQFYPYVM